MTSPQTSVEGISVAVGGAVGGFVALLAIITIITCVVVVLVKGRSRQQPIGIQENNGMGFGSVAFHNNRG